MDLPDDPLTLALSLDALLLIALACCLPAIIRTIRIRGFERALGDAYMPFLVALEQRDSIHGEPTDRLTDESRLPNG